MKIFVITEMIDMSISVKILKDDGQSIILRGGRCDQHIPAYGIDLFEGEQERLIEWLRCDD